jgi:hypothetical protein
MSFLAKISDFYFPKIAIQNMYLESEVGHCWIGLSLAADCGFMHLSYTQRSSVLLGLRRLLAQSPKRFGGRGLRAIAVG